MNKSMLLLIAGLLASCSHGVKSVEDLRINDTFPLVGNPDTKHCSIQVHNIATVMSSPAGPMPLSALGTEAMVCGKISCAATKETPAQEFWECGDMALLKD